MVDKTKSSARKLSDLLPEIMQVIEKNKRQNPTAVLAYWKEVIGKELFPMTKAVKLEKGILFVKVKSSTLFSLLKQYEKHKLLKKIQKKFTAKVVRDLSFKLE